MLKNILGKNKQILNSNKDSAKNFLFSNFLNTSFKCFGAYRSNPALSVPYQKEKAEYKIKRKEMNKQHIKDFWEEQTRVENQYLEDFMKTHKEKKRRDDSKLRSRIIKNSMKCYTMIQDEIENQKVFLAKQKLWREEEAEKLLEKHSILDILDRQAEEDWLTPDNIDIKLNSQMNKILPPTILSHSDYYRRLNNYALLMETGQIEKAEEVKLNKKVIDWKNKQLLPLYAELKMIIKHLTYTEEHSVFALYKDTILRIENSLDPQNNKEGTEYLKDNVSYLFKKLISLIRLENEKADNKLEIIEKQIKALTMIIVIWNRYVDIIYTSEEKAEELIAKEKQNAESFKNTNPIKGKTLEELTEENNPSLLKEYYLSQITDKKAKGSGLFIDDVRGLYDDPYIRNEVDHKSGEGEKIEKIKNLIENQKKKEEYTTDSDGETEEKKPEKNSEKIIPRKEGEKKENEKDKKTEETKKKKDGKKKTGINAEKRKMIENEAVEAFEDEEEEVSTSKTEVADKEIDNQVVEDKNITSSVASITSSNLNDKAFTDPLHPKIETEQVKDKIIKRERKLMEEYMLKAIKKDVESSKYSNLDVEYELKKSKANLMKQLGIESEKDIFADIDKELEEVDVSNIINVNEYENELKRENDRLTLEKEFSKSTKEDLFTSSLFNSIVRYSKDIFDFKKPKISTDLDIYDQNLLKFLEYSAEESNLIYKSATTSLVMEFIKDELNKLNEDELSPSNKLKRKHLMRIAEILGKMRIQDSQNLKQVYDVNKHPLVKF